MCGVCIAGGEKHHSHSMIATKDAAGDAKTAVEGYVKASESFAKEAEAQQGAELKAARFSSFCILCKRYVPQNLGYFVHSELEVTASRVEGEIKAREAALIEAVRARTAELIGENKAWHQVCDLSPKRTTSGSWVSSFACALRRRQRAKSCTRV